MDARNSKSHGLLEDDLHRVEEHVADARRMVQRQKGLIVRFGGRGRNHVGCAKDSLAAGIQSTAIGGTQRPAQGKRPCSAQGVTFITVVTRQASDHPPVSGGYSGAGACDLVPDLAPAISARWLGLFHYPEFI